MDFEVRQVYYSYGKTVALDGLSFSANRGKIVDLIGENGAGKSTAIKSIYRFLPPDKGMILWDGKDIFSLRPDTYPISYIPDTPVFYEELSLLEHLHFTKAVYPQSGASETELLERLDMREHQNKIPSALSKGTRQKLMIATVYKGNIIKNLIMDCQSYTKYRPNETTGGIFVSWRRKEELPTGA